jgi:hypothetical protein
MRSKALFVVMFLTLAAFGCGGVGPTPTVETLVAPGSDMPGTAAVESVEILILESFPVQVNVVARGNLVDACARIDQVLQERDGNTFRVTITTLRPAAVVCPEGQVPFEKVISLDVYGLPAGMYAVTVNGVSGTFELAVDNVLLEEPSLGSVGGVVWHDLCAVPYETVSEPPAGCVMLADGGLEANGVLESGEPGIEGVAVSLGAGPCPSPGIAMAFTMEDGSYVFSELAAGTYCISVDPLDPTNETILIPGGWTYPGEEGTATITVGAGEAVSDVNFGWDYQFLPSPEPVLGSIGGVVWHDLCAVPYETVTEPPEGCVMLADGGLEANGVLEPGEPGIAGVAVSLGAGACPSTGVAAATTGGDGSYVFPDLAAGTYCVSIDPLDATNESILIPGDFTYPAPGVGSATVNLTGGAEVPDVDFGWDYQFLP